jgi:membrane protein YqaA with SNARE-associated domain
VTLLWSVFGASVASALFPLINIEAILAVAANRRPEALLALVLVATIGQMLGKLIWYWGGMNLDRAPWVHRHLQKPRASAALERWHERAEGRPWFTAGLLLFSAAVGFPPYAVTAVLAGVLRVPLVVFVGTGLLGRGLRFWVIVTGTSSLLELW